MANWYYAQIEWLGNPTRKQVKEANRRLREIDYDAPRLDVVGYDGPWREPIKELSTSDRIAKMLDVVFPCRVRIAVPDYGTIEIHGMSAEDVCKESAWVYSRPLFKEGVATRIGTMRLVYDDGMTGARVQVLDGEKWADIIAKIGCL